MDDPKEYGEGVEDGDARDGSGPLSRDPTDPLPPRTSLKTRGGVSSEGTRQVVRCARSHHSQSQ